MLSFGKLVAGLVLGSSLKVGAVAPNFKVKDTDGVELELSALVEKGPVILAFFPKAFTSGCTTELTTYTTRFGDIDKAGAKLIAVSSDDLETQREFKASLSAPYNFVADDKGVLIELYDVKVPVVTYAKRLTFVIGKGRKIVHIDSGSDAIDPAPVVRALQAYKK